MTLQAFTLDTPQRRYAAAHPDRVKESKNRYYRNHRAAALASRERYKRSPAGLAQRLKVYGVSLEEYEALLAAQEGRCAICHRPPAGGRTSTSRLHVDHDHATGEVRGLLCHNCNLGLGHLADADLLDAAAAYLRRVP